MTADTIETRNHVHAMWASVAAAWENYADDVDDRGRAMTATMLTGARIAEGDHVLELASGPGGAGIAAAVKVGRTGRVVVSDVVPAMVQIAQQRAERLGLGNVEATVLDLEAIDQPDASFDVIICREGLMFAVQPERALAEIRRVLRPGGRFTASVWGPRPANPWLGVLLDVLSEAIGRPVPPPGMPGPFALADTDELGRLLEEARFAEAHIDTVSVPLHAASFEAWWARTRAIAGPVTAIINNLGPARQTDLEQHLRTALAPFQTATGLELPGTSHLISAE